MKTYNKVTKKAIEAAIRSGNLTKLVELAIKSGEVKGNGSLREIDGMCAFISKYSPSCRAYKLISDIYFHAIAYSKWDYSRPSKLTSRYVYIVDYLKEQVTAPLDGYTKLPFRGYTHLYFCSPTYGHRDYNKWRALPIEGNEAFVDAVLKFAHKHIDY